MKYMNFWHTSVTIDILFKYWMSKYKLFIFLWYFRCCFMGSNKSRKQVSLQKTLWQAHASASAANIKKIIADPTPNKGNPGSLTIVAHDTGPLVSVSRHTVCGLLKIFTYIYYSAHEIPIAAQSRQGHASSFIKHSYARRSYSAPR
jgi:hypothetical protein